MALLDTLGGADIEHVGSDASEDDAIGCSSSSKYEFDSDGCPFVSDNILQGLQKEVEAVLANPLDLTCRSGGKRQCPFCPFRTFKQLRQLRVHVTKHHTKKTQFTASGTKQLKIILSLYDDAASTQSEHSSLLRQSAEIIRETVLPPLSCTINHIDREIRLVYDESGPMYVNLACIGSTVHARRVRNMYYTHSFADVLVREMVLSHAQAFLACMS